MCIFTAIQQFQIFKYLLLQSNQYPRNQLFIRNSILFQAIGHHIIYILDKDNIGIQVIQILNQRAVPSRTEQQFAFIAERFVLHIGSNRIRTRLLFRKRHIIFHPVFLCINGNLLFHQLCEQLTMFRRDGEMHIHFSGLACRIQRTLHQMFFQRCTHTIRIPMEFQQPLR